LALGRLHERRGHGRSRDPRQGRSRRGGLARCQEANGGEWLGSIPEKYLERIAAGSPVWAPQYTVHKTFMGLMDAYRYIGSTAALELAERWAGWFHRWTAPFSREQLNAILAYEPGGMLEIWADLYGITGERAYRELMDRYARPLLFDALLAGADPLSNMHANTTIPEILGAARAYEVTGEARWLDIARAYWESPRSGCPVPPQAAAPPARYGCRKAGFPSARRKNQELCTVYNLMRLAEFFLRRTGEARYADYWERNLRNGCARPGVLEGDLTHGEKADHPLTGLVSYFLPLRPGSVKLWASETDHFFCCHGSNVQANATHTAGISTVQVRGSRSASTSSRSSRGTRGRARRGGDPPLRPHGGYTADRRYAPRHPAPPDRQAFTIRVTCPHRPSSRSPCACRGGSREKSGFR
jgi:DUF1680 family protein